MSTIPVTSVLMSRPPYGRDYKATSNHALVSVELLGSSHWRASLSGSSAPGDFATSY
jgi:hypothetical protein